jgi:hypothetical protein
MNNNDMFQRGNYNNIDQITLNKKFNNLKQLLSCPFSSRISSPFRHIESLTHV